MEPANKENTLSTWGKMTRSWFLLTRDEQKAVIVITALLALGLTVWLWRSHKGNAENTIQFQQTAKLADSALKK